LREVYEAVAEAVYLAWQARYDPSFDSKTVFKEVIAVPLSNALAVAKKMGRDRSSALRQ